MLYSVNSRRNLFLKCIFNKKRIEHLHSSGKIDGRNGRLVSHDKLVRRRHQLLMVKAFHGDVDVVDATPAAGVGHLSDGRDHALLVTVVHADQALVRAADLYSRILFRKNTKNWKVLY